jgi:D-amino peptidase
MKAFVSVDLEGMPHIVSRGHLLLKGKLYDEARKIATRVTMAAVEELHDKGFSEVVIADSHGPMVNLLVEDLPEYVEIVRGFPRPLNMVSGVEGCDCALFLGYHAKYGTAKATFDHTFMGATINRVKVNGVEVSEFLINGYAAGEMNVPVILVAGDAQLLADDVKKHAPWAEAVALKHSLSRVSARSFGMPRIEKDLKKAVGKAVASFNKGKAKTLVSKKPVKMEVTFIASHFADIAELSPTVKRTDGLSVEYVARDFVEAYKTFELLSLASYAMVSILENQV